MALVPAQVAFQNLLLAPVLLVDVVALFEIFCSSQIVNSCIKMERYAQKKTPTFQLNIDNGNSSVFIPTPKCLGHLEDLKLSHLVVSGIHLPLRHLHKTNLMPVTQSVTNNKC